MPQPKKGPRLGNSAAHQQIMLGNLATELIRHGRIKTTVSKAKTVQPLAERMITFAKRGDIHARRQVLKVIRDKDVVHKLFADVGPAFSERNGGYTRVIKLGPRKGDAAPMALIELVEGSGSGDSDLTEAPRRRWSLRRRSGTLSVAARERNEDLAAAFDRGEQPMQPEFDEHAGHDHDHEDDLEDDLGAVVADDPDAGVQADAAEVEARLAAEDEADEAAEAETSDESEADAEADADADADAEDEDEAPAGE